MQRFVAVLLGTVVLYACQSNIGSMPSASQFSASVVRMDGPCTAVVLVPLYAYPGPLWTEIIRVRHMNSTTAITVIVNPANGPGTSSDPKYVAGIARLQKAHITVLGYDHTSYGSRPIGDVENDALLYHQWYAVDGIFFDEMASVAGHEQYYSTVSAYAKSLGMHVTIGNPGTDTVPSYVGTVDSMVIYESKGYPPLSRFQGWHTSYPPATWGSISYGVGSFNLGKVCQLHRVAGYIYVTNDTLPNPYDTLPPYFNQLVVTL